MTAKIRATFVRKRIQDNGRSQAPDYYVYEFKNIVDSNGIEFQDKWIKETKLLKAVHFQKGKQYEITLSRMPHSLNAINLPFPIEVAWDNEKVFIKRGNSIIHTNTKEQEKNLSIPITRLMGINNYETAACNKFRKGMMTEDLLLKMNSRGVFFQIHYYDPQDLRKFGGMSTGFTKEGKMNYVLIQKETKEEVERDLKSIKKNYFKHGIEKYFEIRIEMLVPKKKKTIESVLLN